MLTPRQTEVLELLAEGLRSSDIQKRLYLTKNTVKFHYRWIKFRMEAKTLEHAVAIGFREGILS